MQKAKVDLKIVQRCRKTVVEQDTLGQNSQARQGKMGDAEKHSSTTGDQVGDETVVNVCCHGIVKTTQPTFW